MSRLDKALNSLKKKGDVDVEESSVSLDGSGNSIPCISTGSVVLNYMIGGNTLDNGEKQCPGIPRGRITEVFGPQGSGKTTLGIETAIKAQQEGGAVCYLDYENAISPAYAKGLGLDFDPAKFQLMEPRHWEEGAEIIGNMIDAGVDLIVVDSVASMKPKDDVDKDSYSETGQIGHIARLMSDYLPKINGPLSNSNTALMLINQLRSRIKTSMYDTGPDEETSGGRAIKYYTSLRLKLRKVKTEYAKIENEMTGEEEKQPVSDIIRGKCVKCKVSPHQGHKSEFVIRYGEGVDNIRSVIDIASARGIIRQSGPWYKFTNAEGEEEKVQGKEKLRKHFIHNQDDFNRVVKEVSQFSQGYDSIDSEDIDDEDIEVEEVDSSEG